ncbi:MAG: hypothetical protein K5785_00965 [Nitrosarchaeum sp.]|nr:hypothetical protein [Nitrosarchaeum sp.]
MAVLSDVITAVLVQFSVWIVLGIAGTIGASLFAYFRSVKKCQMETNKEVDKISKRTFRQSQSILLIASAIDNSMIRNHNEQSTLKNDVSTALRDENGNL